MPGRITVEVKERIDEILRKYGRYSPHLHLIRRELDFSLSQAKWIRNWFDRLGYKTVTFINNPYFILGSERMGLPFCEAYLNLPDLYYTLVNYVEQRRDNKHVLFIRSDILLSGCRLIPHARLVYIHTIARLYSGRLKMRNGYSAVTVPSRSSMPRPLTYDQFVESLFR